MPFRDPVDGLRDIRDAIDLIERFTAGMDFEAFREDPKTVAAVERKLLVISEAPYGLANRVRYGAPISRGTRSGARATGSDINRNGSTFRTSGTR